jgi:hypothetical protein
MKRVAMCPPIPVVCPVEWPYGNKFPRKNETINAHDEDSGRTSPVRRVNYNITLSDVQLTLPDQPGALEKRSR